MVTFFIFSTLIEVAIVCYIESKHAKRRKRKERERKMRAFKSMKRFERSRENLDMKNVALRHQSFPKSTTFSDGQNGGNNRSARRTLVGENEYETARLLHSQNSVSFSIFRYLHFNVFAGVLGRVSFAKEAIFCR